MVTDNIGSVTSIEELEQFLDRYCMDFMVPSCEFDPKAQEALGLKYDDLLKLSSDQCYSMSLVLCSYVIYLRKELDKMEARIRWCEEIINKGVGREWKNFPDFMKYEVRRQAVISQDTFLTKVENLRMNLEVAAMQTRYKIPTIEKMSDTLRDLGRKRSYDR